MPSAMANGVYHVLHSEEFLLEALSFTVLSFPSFLFFKYADEYLDPLGTYVSFHIYLSIYTYTYLYV